MPRLLVRHALILMLGTLSLWAQYVYRVPSRFMAIAAIIICAVLSALQLVLALVAVTRSLAADSVWRRSVDTLERFTSILVLVFGFYGMFLLFNGVLDQSQPASHRSELLAIRDSEIDVLDNVPFLWAELAPWQPGHSAERLLLTSAERAIFWSAGQRVVVSERRGYFGVRWVSAIDIDQEWRASKILASRPSAAFPLRDLARFHVRHRRYPEALRAGSQYLERRPRDFAAAVWLAKAFFNDNQIPAVRDILAPIVDRHRERDTYVMYGAALSRTGRASEGIAWLERSLELDPDFWFTYYLIGVAWTYTGDYRAAIPKFEEAIRRGAGLDMTEAEYALKVARDMARIQPVGRAPVTSR